MSFYSTRVYPHLMDRILGNAGALRGAALQGTHGNVLEIGFGTGLNLPHYPPTVRRLVAVDIAEPLPTIVKTRTAGLNFELKRVVYPGGSDLPFSDREFDCVVTTWTLCCVEDVAATLREIWRVLGSGGRYHFLEHGRSPSESIARWQRRLNPLAKHAANGCRLDLQVAELVEQNRFRLITLKRFTLSRALAIATEMFQGVAAPRSR